MAGEACEDTRALVESALAADADLRAEAATLETVPSACPPLPDDLGLDSLRRTQRLLRRRAVLAAFSVFFSTFSLALVGRGWGLPGHLGQTACLLIAAAGWALFFKNAERMHAAGLDAPRTPHPVWAWYCATALYAIAVLLNLEEWTGRNMGPWSGLIVWIFWGPVAWIGRRLHQLREASEIREIESLLSLARDPKA